MRYGRMLLALGVAGVFIPAVLALNHAAAVYAYRHPTPRPMVQLTVREPGLLEARAYHDEAMGFTLRPPRGWERRAEGGTQGWVEPGGGGAIAVRVVTGEPTSFARLAETNAEQVRRNLPAFELRGHYAAQAGGRPAAVLEYVWRDHDGTSYHSRQLLVQGDGVVFFVTATTPERAWAGPAAALESAQATFAPTR